MVDLSQTVLVAVVTGAFGAKGEIKVKSFTDDPAACMTYAPFVDEQGQVILEINKWRTVKGGFAVRSPDIKYRDEAAALRGTRLYCLREQLPEPEPDEFYNSDLIGLTVFGPDDKPMGRIGDVLNFGASDLLEICDTPGVKGSWMLPFTMDHVPVVSITEQKVQITNWQDFLLDSKETSKKAEQGD